MLLASLNTITMGFIEQKESYVLMEETNEDICTQTRFFHFLNLACVSRYFITARKRIIVGWHNFYNI